MPCAPPVAHMGLAPEGLNSLHAAGMEGVALGCIACRGVRPRGSPPRCARCLRSWDGCAGAGSHAKYGWARACSAVQRSAGFRATRWDSRSRASAGASGKMSASGLPYMKHMRMRVRSISDAHHSIVGWQGPDEGSTRAE